MREELPPIALRKRRGGSLAIVGVCVLAFCAMLYLLITSSRVEESDPEIVALRSAQGAPRNSEPEPAAEQAAAPEPPPKAAATLQPAEPAEPAEIAAEPAAEQAAADPAPEHELTAPPEGTEPPPASAQAPVTEQPAAPTETAIHPAATPPAVAEAPVPVPVPVIAEAPAPQEPPPSEAAEPAPAKPAEPVAAETAEPAAPAAAPQTETAAAAPQPAAATATEPWPADQGRFVRLDVAAFPPTTQIRLDGAPIQNPYNARLPRASRHRIDARAPGYLPQTHMLRMEADARLMIALKREPATGAPAPAAAPAPPARAAQPAKSRGAGFVSDNPY